MPSRVTHLCTFSDTGPYFHPSNSSLNIGVFVMARLSHCAKSTPPQQADGASNLQRSRAQHIFDMWGIGPCGSRHTIESKLSIVMNVHTSMPAWLVARRNKAIYAVSFHQSLLQTGAYIRHKYININDSTDVLLVERSTSIL